MIACSPIQFEEANTSQDGHQSDKIVLKLLISTFHFGGTSI